jgi:aspartyl/glutamyl-tRNA(Asn/Gln) amidotransferase C subunit
MNFDASDVQKLAALARLDLQPEAAERMAGELTRILAYVENLADIEASSGEAEGNCPRRPDVPVEGSGLYALSQSVGWNGKFVELPPVKEES